MKKVVILLGFSLLGQWISGQEVIELWENGPIADLLSKEEPASKTEGGVTRLSNVTNPRLTIFRPSDELDNGQSIIVCPGGGYQILAIDLEGTEIAEWLTTHGYTAYVLEYRVPKQREGALQDVQRALRIVRSRIGSHAKLGVLGFSAGGHLAASASTRYEELSYLPEESMQNVSSRPDFAILIYPAYLDKGPNESLSPEIQLSSDTPPFFIFMTADDPYSGSSIAMAEALRKNQTSVEFHLLPEGGHGYGMRKGSEAAETWPELLKTWLKKQ